MLSSPECSELDGENPGSMRFRYYPRQPRWAGPSGLLLASSAIASTTNMGLRQACDCGKPSHGSPFRRGCWWRLRWGLSVGIDRFGGDFTRHEDFKKIHQLTACMHFSGTHWSTSEYPCVIGS